MSENLQYYDIHPILSKRDINGNIPKKVIACTNRAAGKTHAAAEHLLSFYRKRKYRKIGLLCRYKYEMDDCVERFFSVSDWKHPEMRYSTGKKSKMGFAEILIDDKLAGYVICLSAADNIKASSGIFKELDCVVWDEFQREDGRYLPDEAMKINSVISSICRGGGNQDRYCRFIFLSNLISLLSPLISDLQIEKKLCNNTHFLRGEDFIFEQSVIKSALESQKKVLGKSNSAIKYVGGEECVYLNDNKSAICKPNGIGKYIETFVSNGKEFAIYFYMQDKLYFCSKGVDKFRKDCYTKDINSVSSSVLIATHTPFYKKAFEQGRFCFEDLECKSELIKYIVDRM